MMTGASASAEDANGKLALIVADPPPNSSFPLKDTALGVTTTAPMH